MALCAELSDQIDKYELLSVRRRDPVLDFIPQALRHARALGRSLHRLKQSVGGHPWRDVDNLRAALVAFEKKFGGVRPKDPNSIIWQVYAHLFTRHIIDTLHRAGWRKVSATSALGPVTAVLSMLIGLGTGGEPPDPDTLGKTLRQAAIPKTRRKSSSKPSDAARGPKR
jgi:hypothetical protein